MMKKAISLNHHVTKTKFKEVVNTFLKTWWK